MVKCDNCNGYYEDIFPDTKQGDGCASVLFLHDGKYWIQGNYGSYVADMRKLELKPDTSYNIGIICDKCIERLKADNLVVNEEDTAW